MALLGSCRTLKNARNLTLSIMVTSLAFINLDPGDVTIEILTLALSGLLWLESFRDVFAMGPEDKTLPWLSILVSGTGIMISGASLGLS